MSLEIYPVQGEKKMKTKTVFSKKKSGRPKVAIQLCHLEKGGGGIPGASAGRLTDPSKLHLHNFGYWWLNLSFLILLRSVHSKVLLGPRKLKTPSQLCRNGFPCKFTNMGLKTPTCAHGTFKPALYPPWGEWPPFKTSQAFFTPYAMPPWEWPRLATPANHRKQP